MKTIAETYKNLPVKLMLTGTTALASVLFVPSAFAQEAPDEPAAEEAQESDEIVVTGIRSALRTAKDLKRNADTNVDSITASDVSTLPDLSVAEALARVPGVTVQRIGLGESDGDFPSPEGGQNLIRGLTLVKTELNGRDAFSANAGRALDFGTVPPELIGAVDVFKNTTADRVEGGIGGGINLRTLEPFDRSGRIAVFTLDGTYTDLREELSPDASIVLGDRWVMDNGAEFGILGSVSYSELKSALHGYQIGHLIPEAVGTETIGIPSGFQLRTNEVDRDRESYYIAAQYRNPSDTLEATFKYALIENGVTSDERTMEWFAQGEPGNWQSQSIVSGLTTVPFTSSGIANCQGEGDPLPTDGSTPVCEQTSPITGLYQSGVLSNEFRDWTGGAGAPFTNLGIHQQDTSSTDDISLNVKWRPADNWFVNADVHRTTAEAKLERLWGGTRFFSDFEMNLDLDNPEVRLIPDPANNPLRRFADGTSTGAWNGGTPLSGDFSDPSNSFLLFAADEFQDNEGDMTAGRLDLEYEYDGDGWFDGVQFGGRYAERNQTNRSAGLNWAAVAPVWAANSYLPVDQSQVGGEAYDFADFFRGGVVQGDNTTVNFVNRDLLRDYDAFVAALASDPLIAQNTVDGNAVYQDWNPLRVNGVVDYEGRGSIGDITETTTNFYGRLNFGEEFANGMSVEGNVGVRYSGTDVETRGVLNYVENFSAEVTTFAPETDAYLDTPSQDLLIETSDEHWLPSLNVKWNLNDDMLIRFGASRDITRPQLQQLRAEQTNVAQFNFITDTTTIPSTVTDVNPVQINVFGGNPLLSAIESTNFDLSYEYYFGGDNSFSFALFRKDIENNIFYGSIATDVITLDGETVPIVFNGDLNQDEAVVQGYEIAYQQFFDDAPGLLANTGIQANYTFIDSETNAPVPFVDADGDGAPDNFGRIYRYGVNDFLGLSEQSANLIGIYQDEKMEARLAYNWRSEHLSSYRDYVTGNPVFQEDRGYLDGSFKYDFTDQFQFRVQVANILDTKAKAQQQIDQEGQRLGRTSFIGDRRVKFGVRYSF